MRRKYIRFFISSTFADMEVERNLLQELFCEVAPLYRGKGWQIEAVDLRWGVNAEAGYHNKTMRICVDELRRCQELSPKPNFIVLLGDRYGWVPLPEIIDMDDYLQLVMSDDERKTFELWYSQDNNALPDGQYVLRARYGVYRKEDVWQQEAVAPLSAMFQRNMERSTSVVRSLFNKQPRFSQFFGRSATEIEIESGALKVEDAREHVVAYFRHFTDEVQPPADFFVESGLARRQQADLKARLRSKLSGENIYDTTLSYADYASDAFCQTFKQSMRQRLVGIIDSVIAEYCDDASDDDNKKHLGFAADQASGFVGRTEDMAYIDHYLHDQASDKVLWVKASSGSGKSTLLSAVVNRYRSEFRVFCRFCGRTEDSSAGSNLLQSIWWNLHQVDISGKCKHVKCKEDFAKDRKPWECMQCKLKNLRSDKPVLVIIDAIDQAEEDVRHFLRLKWLDCPLPPELKVIVSSTDDVAFSFESEHLAVYPLPNMGIDALRMVQDILQRRGRRLSTAQTVQIQHVIARSDQSAIYLYVLANYLCTVPVRGLQDIPPTLDGLVGYILDELSLDKNHGPLMVRKAITLLTTERTGLSQAEMLDLLSADDELYRQILKESQHDIPPTIRHRIPPVLWSRLLSDIQPFLRNVSTKSGQVVTLYHNSLKQAIAAHFLTTDAARCQAALSLYNYYQLHIGQKTFTRHALQEVVYTGVEALRYARSFDKSLFQQIGNSLINLLTSNASFLAMKSINHSQSLMEDFQKFFPYCSPELQKKLFSTQIELLKALDSTEVVDDFAFVQIRGREIKPSEEHIYCYLKNLPSDSSLRQSVEKFSDIATVMENAFSDSASADEDATMYVIPELGECPRMSDDGSRVASLFRNRHDIVIADLRDNQKTRTITVNHEVQDIQCDSDMTLLAVQTSVSLVVYDLIASKQLHQRQLSPKSVVSMSDNGELLGVFDDGEMEIVTKTGEVVAKGDHALSAKLSPSGQYVWMLGSGYTLCRYNVATGTLREVVQFNKEDIKERISYDDDTQKVDLCKTILIACSDDRCIVDKKGETMQCVQLYDTEDGDFLLKIAELRGNRAALGVGGNVLTNQYGFTMLSVTSSDTVEYVQGVDIEWIQANRDLSVILSQESPFARIVDATKLKARFDSSGNTGVNSLACSADGKKIWAAAGINEMLERVEYVVKIDHGKRSLWKPPVQDTDYSYIAQIATSPDGSKLALSVLGTGRPRSCECLIGASDGKKLEHFFSGEFACIGLSFTEDSRYLVAKTGHYIATPDPQLYLLTSGGKQLADFGVLCGYPSNDFVSISRNNRFVFLSRGLDGIKDHCIDLIRRCPAIGDTVFYRFHSCVPTGMMLVREKYFVVQPPTANAFLSMNQEGNLCYINLESMRRTTIKVDEPYEPIASSPSGKYIYLHNDETGKLYMWQWLDPESPGLKVLMGEVLWMVPALDDDHIFIVRNDYMILLYNVCTGRVEQKAYFGRTIHQKICREGLVVVNDHCDIALLKPDAALHVNTLVPTSFVRHWNLETGIQESPEAVCPACGCRIKMPYHLSAVLKPAPPEMTDIRLADWNDKRLSGHRCPQCKTALVYTPYII